MEPGLIYIIIAICAALALLLTVVLIVIWRKDKKTKNQSEGGATSKGTTSSTTKLQGIESMSKFLDFDQVIDSMIVRKKGTQYVMVIQCKGVNYDLLGEEEKIATENGFIQFLNTIRFPIQLYIQTRSLNLKDSIEQYEKKVNEVRSDIAKLEMQIKKETANGRVELVRKLEFDRRRKMNILEYGLDITNYVSRMSQNRSVLKQNTYLIVSYYTSEFGGEISNYSKSEIDSIAFSELYTRAQTVIRALASSGVSGKVIDSEELIELLYIAYNRDDSELISVKKSVDAQYDSLYNTARDVFEKQKQILEEKIDKTAIELTAKSITKADTILKMKKQSKQLIRQRALEYLEQYKNEMNDELYNETKKQVEEAEIGRKKSTKGTGVAKTKEKTAATKSAVSRTSATKSATSATLASRKAAAKSKIESNNTVKKRTKTI